MFISKTFIASVTYYSQLTSWLRYFPFWRLIKLWSCNRGRWGHGWACSSTVIGNNARQRFHKNIDVGNDSFYQNVYIRHVGNMNVRSPGFLLCFLDFCTREYSKNNGEGKHNLHSEPNFPHHWPGCSVLEEKIPHTFSHGLFCS